MFKILKTKEGKKFLIALMSVFIIALALVSRATFVGIEEQYNMPMAQWSLFMFLIQGAWTLIYSIMFTLIGALPFGFYFLGPKDNRKG